MSWQERDYASQPARGYAPGGGTARYGAGPGWRGAGPSWCIGGSIVTTLIVINVAVFLLEAISPALKEIISGVYGMAFGGVVGKPGLFEMRSDLVARGQIWRLITAQYLHAGTWHILFNMIALHFLGRPLEQMWSVRRFFGIYTACGVIGNIFYTFVVTSSVPAVGASGSIYGLLGIVAVMFPHATVYIYFLFPLKIRTAAIILGVIAFLTIQSRGGNYGGEACHLAGLVFGVWWAMRGDAWWSSTQWRFLPRGSGRARRGPTKTYQERVGRRRADQETIDRILRKVYDGGIHSLTEAEKRTLQDATERQRRRDAEMGRVDRV
jgi:membrane associated rhomboid family serine protease